MDQVLSMVELKHGMMVHGDRFVIPTSMLLMQVFCADLLILGRFNHSLNK